MRHPDQCDMASEYEAENLRINLANQRANRNTPLPVTGRCYNCGEETAGKFCPPVSGTISECYTDFVKRYPRFKQC